MTDQRPVLVLVSVCLLGVFHPSPSRAEPSDAPSDESSTDEQSSSRSEGVDASPTLEELLDDLEEAPERQRETVREGEQDERRRDEIPIDSLTLAEAKARGFEFGDETPSGEGRGATLAALTLGAAFHGAGHFVAGEPRAGWSLLASQAVGGGLLVSGIVGSNNARGGWSVGLARSSAIVGAGILGVGYLADVAGTLPTEGTGFPRNYTLRRGFSLEAGYTFRRTSTTPLSHFARLAADYDGDWWSIRADTEHELQFSASSVSLEAVLEPALGRSELTRPRVSLGGEYLVGSGEGGFRRWTASAGLGGIIDLAVLDPGLSMFAVGGSAGIERSWLSWNGSSYASWLPNAEVFSHVQFSQRLFTEIGYRLDPNEWLAADRRLAGVGRLMFVFDTEGPFDLRLGGRLGEGFAVVTGLRYHP